MQLSALFLLVHALGSDWFWIYGKMFGIKLFNSP